MRASTLLFLGVFGGFALLGRARLAIHHDGRCHSTPRAACSSSRDAAAPTPARSATVRALEREHEQLADRSRELDRSLHAVDGSLRTLREVAGRPGGDVVREELAAIEAGRAQLQRARQECEAQRAALHARIQLARAGIAAPTEPPAPNGPIDALDQLGQRDGSYVIERPSTRVTSRGR